MGRTHIEQEELEKQVEAARTQVTVGALYRHYKSAEKVYKVIGLGFLEADDTLCVIYQAQYDKQLTFIRPLDVWLEDVEWQGAIVPRFTQLR